VTNQKRGRKVSGRVHSMRCNSTSETLRKGKNVKNRDTEKVVGGGLVGWVVCGWGGVGWWGWEGDEFLGVGGGWC